MPCDSVTTQSINLANADRTLLTETLLSLGFTVETRMSTSSKIFARQGRASIVWEKGKGLEVTTANGQLTIVDVTQAYSKTAVTWAAQRAGWKSTTTGANTLSVTRR